MEKEKILRLAEKFSAKSNTALNRLKVAEMVIKEHSLQAEFEKRLLVAAVDTARENMKTVENNIKKVYGSLHFETRKELVILKNTVKDLGLSLLDLTISYPSDGGDTGIYYPDTLKRNGWCSRRRVSLLNGDNGTLQAVLNVLRWREWFFSTRKRREEKTILVKIKK